MGIINTSQTPNDKIYLEVSFLEKDTVKSLGAWWDVINKKWYCFEHNKDRFTQWMAGYNATRSYNELSNEQQHFIDEVKQGKNVLVDACIGSGKTTAIQVLCNELSDKNILYLTYNTLLKIDARAKIKNKNVFVTNYHGFAYQMLHKVGISTGIGDLIQDFIKVLPPVPKYDVVIIDEYQDIEQEIANMLEYIKSINPFIQIVAVGDMEQKIYDKTSLDVKQFIQSYLNNYTQITFTKCFRLNKKLASRLGRIWNKPINGVNKNCKVSEMDEYEVVDFLAKQNPSDVLCLGARTGCMANTLNTLERYYGNKYNKYNTYASIRNDDTGVRPNAGNAIFTTFDSSKGLERKICCIFDYTEDYFNTRSNQPGTNQAILRNIFCVAASRGKEQIIFVKQKDKTSTKEYKDMLKDETLMAVSNKVSDIGEDFYISNMFDFKYIEDIMECYSYLDTKCIQEAQEKIDIKNSDGLIDLSPCIGLYQEASYFKNYSMHETIKMRNLQYRNRPAVSETITDIQKTILNLTAQETCLTRYTTQVKLPFINKQQKQAIHDRLNTKFNPDVDVQGKRHLDVKIQKTDGTYKTIHLKSMYDVRIDDIIYELKFVNELSKTHFLQLACYLFIYDLEMGILWNVQDNTQYEVRIKDRNAFIKSVIKCITKRYATLEEVLY